MELTSGTFRRRQIEIRSPSRKTRDETGRVTFGTIERFPLCGVNRLFVPECIHVEHRPGQETAASATHYKQRPNQSISRHSLIQSNIEEGVLRMTKMGNVVQFLKLEHARLTKQIDGVSAALAAFGEAYTNGRTGGRKISAAGRARISAAQKVRWSEAKGNTTNGSPARKTRSMSATSRKKIAAAQRARWRKVKAPRKP